MAPRRSKRFALAAWLGLIAVAFQAFIPALVAAEITAAHRDGAGSVFELCIFGHVHSAPGGGPSLPPSGDENSGTVCPICIALLASPPFTPPPAIALPLPRATPAEALVLISDSETVSSVATAYRSRAPPAA